MKKKLPLWLRILLMLLATIFVLLLSEIVRMPFNYAPLGKMLGHLVAAVGLLGVVYWFRTQLDKESMSSIGLHLKYQQGGWGAVTAIVSVSLVFVVLLLFQLIHVTDVHFNALALGLSLLGYVFVGFFEELVFRGYIQTNLSKALNSTWGLLISSLLFTILHGLNPSITLLGLFNIFLAGLLLGVFYQLSGNLWGAIGFHALWNFWQGPVLGFAVSGTGSYSLLTLENRGADYFTGGTFGLEGSVVCTAVLLSVIALLQYLKQRKRGNG
ncbi:lysostaphin resistance A-like protein [Carboxylicivirga taeanensis]|uniref:CPBP family intramembrane glutamic endopeptidase n=1 Tax=Carboxylicivirga taeanensis TaxID=1416875 RepID=UPI003F6E3B31